jgi:hypothetical protein
MKRFTGQTLVAATLVLVVVSRALAGFVQDIGLALGYVGFDIRGDHNVLSGGTDLLVTNTFFGNELDFGSGDLTLQGPISLSYSSGGRALTELELALRTAPDSRTEAGPINYLLNLDVGNQAAEIRGSLLIDANLTLNGFGYYDLDVRYSSRQTVTREGDVADDSTDYDFDYGPISVSGNVYADILAVLTDPLFEAADQPNPFARLRRVSSGRDLAEDQRQSLTEELATGGELSNEQLARLATQSILDQLLGGTLRGLPAAVSSFEAESPRHGPIVPEPTVLLLMLVGVPVVLRLCRRRVPNTYANGKAS